MPYNMPRLDVWLLNNETSFILYFIDDIIVSEYYPVKVTSVGSYTPLHTNLLDLEPSPEVVS
jgi:hypothetical protein